MPIAAIPTSTRTDDVLSLMDDWGPEKVVCVSDRRTGMKGVLVLDNTARGLGKGGTRMSSTVGVGEIARLARTMTWKWAAADLFYGGAKAGIVCDPSSPNKEQILRSFARALANEVPAEYVFGLDMGMSEPDAAILMDELRDRGAAVGLPEALGGVPYDELGITGYGVAEAVGAAAETMGLSLSGSRVSIQGFGAVGAAAVRRLSDLGATVVAVSTAAGSVVDQDGLDVGRLLNLRAETGDECVLGYGGALAPEEALLTATDILIPAAREDVIGDEVATRTTAQLIVEGANMPTTVSARALLFKRGIEIVPDFIANAGAVIAAAYSMDARYSAFPVDVDAVFATVSRKLRATTTHVLAESRDLSIPPHEAALVLAQNRVRRAMQLRGQCVLDPARS